MKTRSAFPLLLVLVLTTIVATTQSSSAIAPDGGPTASGEGQFTFNHELIDFSFDAKANKHGNARGRAQFDNLSAQTHIEVKINCLSVDSFSAILSGTVLHSNNPDFPKFARVIFAASDGQALPTPRADDITPLFVVPSPEFDCNQGQPLTILPLNAGDILVQP